MSRSEQDRSAKLATAVVLVISVGILVFCQRVGITGRGPAGPSPSDFGSAQAHAVVGRSSEVIGTLEALGVRGRILVYLAGREHFRPIEDAVPAGIHDFPVPVFDLADAYRSRVDRDSLLWVAVRLGIAREVVHVVPPGRLADRPVITHDFGSRRVLTDVAPSFAEPVILGVAASYLEDATVDQAMAVLQGGELEADLVVLCLSDDDPEASDEARARLRQLEIELERGVL